jgi:ABC-type lipoprotein release transport system permease subunit
VIRRRDQFRLSLQKLRLRKKRAAFSIISVALGVIVVVTVNSLLVGLRDVLVTTQWTEQLDPDVVRIYTSNNPYEYTPPDEKETPKKTKKRYQFLTEPIFEEMRGWPGVEAVDHPVTVSMVSITAFTNSPRPVTSLRGAPVAVLARHVTDPARLAACTNVIPIVLAERHLRYRYDEKKHKVYFDKQRSLNSWLGRDVVMRVGDNYTSLDRFKYDAEKQEYRTLSEEEWKSQRESMQRTFTSQYDMTVFSMTLPLKGRIVGFWPGDESLIPLDVARQCNKWVKQRNGLASLVPPRANEEPVYESRGRRTPREGEFTEGILLVKQGANVETLAKRVEELGFSAATRQRAFEGQMKAFDSGLKIVKKIAFAFGAVILLIAAGLVWSTTSRVVSDSRADIGLFRALGATKADIRRLFLSEAVLLGLLGTLVGIVLGWLLAGGISHWGLNFARRQATEPDELLLIPGTIFAFNIFFSLLLLASTGVLSLLAGWWPARRAANVDPVKALKRE